MEGTGGFIGRVGERVLSWVGLALLVALGVAIWQMGPANRQAVLDAVWKTLLWVGLVAALPWSASLFMRRLLDAGTNWAGVGVLVGLILVQIVSGLVLLGGLPTGGWGWMAALAAASVAGTYTFLVLEYLAERAGG